MPSLEDILKKTKAKSEQITTVRKPPSIATEDRPYSTHQEEDLQVFDNSTPPSLFNSEPSNKSTTKWQQTGDKPTTNRQQSDNKLATNQQQPVNNLDIKTRNRQQTGNQTGNTTDNKVVTKWQQTDNKLAAKSSFSTLVGLQRELIIFICHECKNSRSRTTESLTLEHIAKSLKRSTGAVKTTLQRLEKKSYLIRVEFKNGRGGWSRYEVPDNIYHEVLRNETGNKVTTNWQQTDNKVASQLATEPVTSTSSSSSFLNIKETTTTQLSEEWNFDITPYAKFGFMPSQLKQLAPLGVISAMDVEQSLIEFYFDLENNSLPLIKGGKVGFLMGLFRKGVKYTSEAYLNEQEAVISEMARRSRVKRENALQAKFEAWEASLNGEERKEIERKLPTQLMVLNHAHGISNVEVRNWFFNHYLKLSPA